MYSCHVSYFFFKFKGGKGVVTAFGQKKNNNMNEEMLDLYTDYLISQNGPGLATN